MATGGKSQKNPDASPSAQGRRVIRIPFPPKNRFRRMMVELGWAVPLEPETMKDAAKEMPEAPSQPQSVEDEIKLLFSEGKTIELASLARTSDEHLAVVVDFLIREGVNPPRGMITENGLTDNYHAEGKGTSEAEEERPDTQFLVKLSDPAEGKGASETEDERRAMQVLLKLSDIAVPHLRRHFNDDNVDFWSRYIFARSLAQSGERVYIRLIIELADSQNSKLFVDALALKSDIIQDEIYHALMDQSAPRVSVPLIALLAEMGHPEVIDLCDRYLFLGESEDASKLLQILKGFGEEAFPTILRHLDLGYFSKLDQAYAISILQDHPTPEVVSALLTILNSDYKGQHFGFLAKKALGLIIKAGPPAIPAILSILEKTDDERSWQTFAGFLGALECKESVEALGHLASNENPGLRACVATTLGKTRQPSALKHLESLLSDPNQMVAIQAADALDVSGFFDQIDRKKIAYCHLVRGHEEEVDYGDEEVFKFLIASCRHDYNFVRKTAVLALGCSGKNNAITLLISALKDKDPYVRSAAAQALGQNREEMAIKPLIEALGDKEPKVAEKAADSLLIYHQAMDTQDYDEDVISRQLIAAMSHKNPRVRLNAVGLMSEIGISPAVPALNNLALNDQEPSVRAKALKVLGKVSELNVSTFIEALGDDEQEIVEIAIARLIILEDMGYSAVEAALKRNNNPRVRAKAARALARFGNPNALDILAGALNDPNKTVRMAVISSVGSLHVSFLEMELQYGEGGPGAKSVTSKVLKPLLKALEDPAHEVRAKAAGRICDIVSYSDNSVIDVRTLPYLVAILRSDDKDVRDNVVTLLEKILRCCDTEEGVREYLALIEKSSREIRNLAGRAWDLFSKKDREATERAVGICLDFINMAGEKKQQYTNGKGPYR